VPRRGTCIRLNRSDHLLYTEGSEERQTWVNRPPSAVRIRHYQNDQETDGGTREVIGQVFDLSMSNWRAFNARGYPVSILYSTLISRILRHADLTTEQSESLGSGCGSCKMPRPVKVNYLVGAGLCVDAGLPHSVNLAEKLRLYLEDQATEAQLGDAKTQIALLYFLIGGIRFQWARLGQNPDQLINIEQIATAALRLRHRGNDPLAPYVASWSEKVTEFESSSQGIFGDSATHLRPPQGMALDSAKRQDRICQSHSRSSRRQSLRFGFFTELRLGRGDGVRERR